MIKAEFGIIPQMNDKIEYEEYNSENLNLIAIDDELYIDDWWKDLQQIDTFHGNMHNLKSGLNRWGVTIIPPYSIPAMIHIIESDERVNTDRNLKKLLELFYKANQEKKYVIHYGI